MPSWAYWALFLVVGAIAIVAAKRLDDRERRYMGDRRSSSHQIVRPRRDQT